MVILILNIAFKIFVLVLDSLMVWLLLENDSQ